MRKEAGLGSVVLRSGGFEGGGLIFGAGIAPLIALRLGRVLRGSALDFFVKTAKERQVSLREHVRREYVKFACSSLEIAELEHIASEDSRITSFLESGRLFMAPISAQVSGKVRKSTNIVSKFEWGSVRTAMLEKGLEPLPVSPKNKSPSPAGIKAPSGMPSCANSSIISAGTFSVGLLFLVREGVCGINLPLKSRTLPLR